MQDQSLPNNKNSAFIDRCFDQIKNSLITGQKLKGGFRNREDKKQNISIKNLFKENTEAAGDFFKNIENYEQLQKAIKLFKYPEAWAKAFEELNKKEEPSRKELLCMLLLLEEIKKAKPALLGKLDGVEAFYGKVPSESSKNEKEKKDKDAFRYLKEKFFQYNGEEKGEKDDKVAVTGAYHEVNKVSWYDRERVERKSIKEVPKPSLDISNNDVLNSPFIVKSKYETKTQEGQTSELMKGYDGSLVDLLTEIYKENSTLSLSDEELKQITFQAMKGLQTFHEENTIHGDIKLGNILFQKKNGRYNIGYCDLDGCCKVTPDGKLDGGGQPTITPAYATDEVLCFNLQGSFKKYDTYALFLSLIRLTLSKEDAETFNVLSKTIQRKYSVFDKAYRKASEENREKLENEYLEEMKRDLKERSHFLDNALNNIKDQDLKVCLTKLREGKLTEALKLKTFAGIKETLKEDQKTDKSYPFRNRHMNLLDEFPKLKGYTRSTQEVLLEALHLLNHLENPVKPIKETYSAYEKWRKKAQLALDRARPKGKTNFCERMESFMEKMEEKFETERLSRGTKDLFSNSERQVIDPEQRARVLTDLQQQEEGNKFLKIIFHGTSIKKEHQGSIYHSLAEEGNTLILRGIGSNPYILSKDLNAGVALGIGMEKRVDELMEFLSDCKKKGCLPKELKLTGYSRGAVNIFKLIKKIGEKYKEKITIDLTLFDPVIGPFDGLKEKDLTLPENVRSVCITEGSDEKKKVYQGINIHKIKYNPEKTTLTVLGLPGNHIQQNVSRRNEEPSEAWKFNKWLLENTFGKNDKPMPEVTFQSTTKDGRVPILFSPINDNLPEEVKEIHNQLRSKFYAQAQSKRPCEELREALDIKLEKLEDPEKPFNLEEYQEILKLVNILKTRAPAYLPSNQKIFEKLDSAKSQIAETTQEDKYLKMSLDLVKWRLEISDQGISGKSGLTKKLNSLLQDLAKDDDLKAALNDQKFKNDILKLYIQFKKNQREKDPILFYAEELEKAPREGLKNFGKEALDIRKTLNSMAEKVNNRESIENLDQLVSHYKQWMDNVQDIKPKNRELSKLKEAIKKQFTQLVKNPAFIERVVLNEDTLLALDENLQTLKKGSYLNNPQSIKKISQTVTEQVQTHPEKLQRWFSQLIQQIKNDKLPEKGIWFRDQRISWETLFDKGNDETVKAFFSNLLDNLPSKKLNEVFEHPAYREKLDILKLACLDKIRNPQKDITFQAALNILHSLELLRKNQRALNSDEEKEVADVIQPIVENILRSGKFTGDTLSIVVKRTMNTILHNPNGQQRAAMLNTITKTIQEEKKDFNPFIVGEEHRNPIMTK